MAEQVCVSLGEEGILNKRRISRSPGPEGDGCTWLALGKDVTVWFPTGMVSKWYAKVSQEWVGSVCHICHAQVTDLGATQDCVPFLPIIFSP